MLGQSVWTIRSYVLRPLQYWKYATNWNPICYRCSRWRSFIRRKVPKQGLSEILINFFQDEMFIGRSAAPSISKVGKITIREFTYPVVTQYTPYSAYFFFFGINWNTTFLEQKTHSACHTLHFATAKRNDYDVRHIRIHCRTSFRHWNRVYEHFKQFTCWEMVI